MKYRIAALLKESTPDKKVYWTGGGIANIPELSMEFMHKGAAQSHLKKMQQLHVCDSVQLNGVEYPVSFDIEEVK